MRHARMISKLDGHAVGRVHLVPPVEVALCGTLPAISPVGWLSTPEPADCRRCLERLEQAVDEALTVGALRMRGHVPMPVLDAPR